MSGIDRIATERSRQIEAENWTPEHDDTHDTGALAEAAAYLASSADVKHFDNARDRESPYIVVNWKEVQWPWSNGVTTRDRLDALTKAGALIAAEIDRLERAAALEAGTE